MVQRHSLGHLFVSVVPILGCFFKKIPFKFFHIDVLTLLGVLRLEQAFESPVLRSTVVPTSGSGQVAQFLNRVEVRVGGMEHVSENVSYAFGALTLKHHLIIINRIFLLQNQLNLTLRHLNLTHPPSPLNINLLKLDPFATDHFLDKHSLFLEPLLFAVQSG